LRLYGYNSYIYMSELYKNKFRISSARLQTWDYSSNGMYFITICTRNKEYFFGDIVECDDLETQCIASLQRMQLNELGKIAETEWLKAGELRPDMNLELGEYVIMPNHFHGIISIGDNQHNTIETDNNSVSYQKNKFGPQSKNLAAVVRGFKSAVTTFARKNDTPFDWQTRFHDHIIRTHDEYFRIANYILNNPDNWQEDKFYVK
jgi:putative transposase